MNDEIEYAIDNRVVSVLEIQRAAELAWAEVLTVGTAGRADAVRAGIDLSGAPTELRSLLDIRSSGAGVDPTSVLLVVAGALGPGVSKALFAAWQDVWKYVLLPNIRAKWGDEAIKERKRADADAAKKR